METASQNGTAFEEGQYLPGEILKADECFLTNSMIELIPVVRVIGPPALPAGYPIGTGQVGKLTRLLTRTYRCRTAQD